MVTGATGILGEAFVNGLSRSGARVALLGRNEDVGNERMNSIKQSGQEALFIKADVLSKEDLATARDTVLGEWGVIDGLVNAAGGNIAEAVIAPDADVFDMNIEALKKAFDLNLYGTLLPTCIFGKAMSQSAASGEAAL